MVRQKLCGNGPTDYSTNSNDRMATPGSDRLLLPLKGCEELASPAGPHNVLRMLDKVPPGYTVVQPDSCSMVSSSLSRCHECWTAEQQTAKMTDYSHICQFSGFRKIKRLPASDKDLMPFMADGFLDPWTDPTDVDRNLWVAAVKHIRQNLDVATAK